jgi:antitoxin component YwqK of YwqJK toxin-antitoxin module
VNGQRHGLQKIWFLNGQLAKRKNLNEGKEEGLQQAWLENGTLYVNYEAKNGRIFGMNRANLCYKLKNEKVQYAKK